MSARLKIGLLFVASGGLGVYLGLAPRPEPTRLTFLSVGQGDCAVFQTAGRTILIDAGPNVRGFDAGRRIVVPDLRRMGIERIDLILISHPDADHIGGLGAIIRAFPVGAVGVSRSYQRFAPMVERLREARADNVLWLGPDQAARVGDFQVEIACPAWFEGEPDNDGSEFVRISSPRASAVFTGDADSATEDLMLEGHDWSAQVLKLGHHGSRSASGPEWLREVHPRWAVVSCGRHNVYGHPHPSVLARVKGLGISVARTDTDGDVTFTLGPNGFERAP